LHAKQPEDVIHSYLEGLSTVVLVDAVINTGKSIVEVVHHMERSHPKLRIAIVAGTVQQGAIGDQGTLTTTLSRYEGLSLAVLRVSENGFAGTKGTDTGNRLFNTTHLE
jgi:orotate phosphoribosyltransferase